MKLIKGVEKKKSHRAQQIRLFTFSCNIKNKKCFSAEIKYDLPFSIVLVFLLPDLLLSGINLLRRLSPNHRTQYTHLTPYDNFHYLCNNMYASPVYCVFAHELNCLQIHC